MKKLLGSLVFIGAALVLVGALRTSNADTLPEEGLAPQIGISKVQCVGWRCNGPGGTCGTEYEYHVIPGSGASITAVDVGTEDGNLSNYTNVCMPAGWSINLLSISRLHDPDPTVHGVITGNNGKCSGLVRFSGPAMTVPFDLGYDHVNWDYHDVHWKVTGSPHQADWRFPLGLGAGPVHGPLMP